MNDLDSVEPVSASGPRAKDWDGVSRTARLTRIFADVFELESVAPDADFFELGGDSLIAETLVSEVEREFGIGLSISMILEASTPQALAERVFRMSREQLDRILVPVRPSSTRRAVFCVHGTSGESLFPHRLSQHLPGQWPIVGIRALGLEQGETPPATIEAMAELYLTAITAVQPTGPYMLLGQCGGTMAAWEMARRLIAAGQDVAGLVLIDPESHQTVAPFLYRSGLALGIFQADAPKRARDEILHFSSGATGPPSAAQERRLRVREAMYSALGVYSPKPLDCPTLLLCSAERRPIHLNPERGYQHLLKKLEWAEIPGTHYDIFERRMPELSAAIDHFFTKVAPAAAATAFVAA